MNKFRVWSDKRKCWMEHCSVLDSNWGVLALFWEQNTETEETKPIIFPVKEDIVVQLFTSLLAKNGEIYEGDIVRFVQKDGDEIIFQDIGVVKYSHAAFIVDGEPWGKDDHYLGDYVTEGNLTELEIIGNIFENPEILEKSNK